MDELIKKLSSDFLEEENGVLKISAFGCLLLVFGAIGFLNYILDKGSETNESDL